MVSIIVPIYNKERELEQCIKSILMQTYKNLEIILVNDGSTDLSKKICYKFLNLDSRIKLVNKKNQGVELARITGMKYATGKYITFVDPDDWISSSAIELLVNSIQKENADISFGKLCRVIDKYGLIKKQIKNEIYNNKVITKDEFMNKYYDSFCGWGNFPVNMCGKLYKKSFVDTIDYKEVGISHGEDLCFNLQILPQAEKIVSIPENIYFYRWGGMTDNINKNLFKDACIAYNFKLDMFKKHKRDESYSKASVELCNFFNGYIDTYLKCSDFNDLDVKNIIKKEIENVTLQKAVRIPTYDWFVNNEIYKAIKNKDFQAFLNLKKIGLRKRKIKKELLIYISRILN